MIYHKLKILIAIGALALTTASALDATAGVMTKNDFVSTSTFMQAKKWVKIRCTTPGMQQITYDQLRAWGFSNPGSVRVYGFSARPFHSNEFDTTLPDDLVMLNTYRYPTINAQKLLFYNEGTSSASSIISSSSVSFIRSSNLYDPASYYFLAEFGLADGPQVIKADSRTCTLELLNHRSTSYSVGREFNPSKWGSVWFDQKSTDKVVEYEFNLHRPLITQDNRYRARMEMTLGLEHEDYGQFTTDVDISGSSDGITISGKNAPQFNINANNKFFVSNSGAYIRFDVSDANNLERVVRVRLSTTSDLAAWLAKQYTLFSYMRSNAIGNDEPERLMVFDQITTANCEKTSFSIPMLYPKISNPNENEAGKLPVVWDVTNPQQIYELKSKVVNNNRRQYYFPVTRTFPHGYYNYMAIAFHPELTHHSVEYVGDVEQQNIHGMSTPDMLIITNDELRQSAEGLAQVHRDLQGLDVAVVTHKQLLNEFSSGTPHVMAYRLAAKMFYERGLNAAGTESKFKHILMLGPTTWDHPRSTVEPDVEYLLMYQTEDVKYSSSNTQAFTSVDFFGQLDNKFETSGILRANNLVSVGYIKALSPAEVNAVTGKIETYLRDLPNNVDKFIDVITMCDTDDINEFLGDSEQSTDIIHSIHPDITVNKMYPHIYGITPQRHYSLTRDVIAEKVRSGLYFWSFTGHSNRYELGSPVNWDVASANNTPTPLPPIMFLGTCYAVNIDHDYVDLGNNMVKTPGAGAIAVIGSGLSVYSNRNQILNLAFIRSLYGATPGQTIGDVYNAAKNRTNASNQPEPTALNARCYNLMGDPAIPVLAVARSIVAESINSKDVEAHDAAVVEAAPLSTVTITGSVRDGENVDTDFNGTITVNIYDGPRRLISNRYPFTLDQQLLATGKAEAVDGRFTISMRVPRPEVTDTINRVTFTAALAQPYAVALGGSRKLSIVSAPDAITDVVAPTFDQLYIDTPDFTDYDIVSATPVLTAVISDAESGVDTSAPLATRPASLKVDGREVPSFKSMLTPNTDGSVSLNYPLGAMADGHHSVDITICDRAGNIANATLNFRVHTAQLQRDLKVVESPARDIATLYTDSQSAGDSNPDYTIIITDAEGSHVHTAKSQTLPYEWDLRDSKGQSVPDGLYTAKALFSVDGLYGHTNNVDIIVLH